MKLLSHAIHLTTLTVVAVVLLTGCASSKPDRRSLTKNSTNVDARTLADPGLKRFIETNLKTRLELWPLESWDLPKLTLAAWYFQTNLEQVVVWRLRANVRTNLLRHTASQRRLELLNELSDFQSAIIRRGRSRQTESEISWQELSFVHADFANTLIARLDALEQTMQSRVNLAEAVGIPVRALLQVELNYDFSRGTTNPFAPVDLSQMALQNRSDMAGVDRSVAAHRAAQKHLADLVARLSALRRQRDAVAAQVKDGAKTEIELLMLEARLAAARLNVFDAQVRFQHTLGSLEDAVQQPAELLGVGRSKRQMVSTHE